MLDVVPLHLAIDLKEAAHGKITRVLCYVPVSVKKAVQERRANDPRPSPPPENAYFLEMLESGLKKNNSVEGVGTVQIFRIDAKNRKHYVPVGINMPVQMHRDLKFYAKTKGGVGAPGHEPVKYRFIDLVACLLNNGLFGG